MPCMNDLDELAQQMLAKEEEINKLRAEYLELKKQVGGEVEGDYSFVGHDGAVSSLVDLFGDKSDLILVHNMGVVCAYCTMWADGLNGLRAHLEDRAAFVVTSPDSVEIQRRFKEKRGWGFRMYSIDEGFLKDMGFYQDHEKMGPSLPGVSTFHRSSDGNVARVAKSFFGPGDDFCATWHLFDLLAKGADGWEAKFAYGS